MKLNFIIKEGFTGFKRAKFPFIVSVITIAICLSLIGVSIIIGDNVFGYFRNLESDFDVQMFYNPDASRDQQAAALEFCNTYPGVITTRYISKHAAVALFQEEFGENIFEILKDNPFPASVRIGFDRYHQNTGYISGFIASLEQLPGVDTVTFHKELFLKLTAILRILTMVGGVFLLLLFIASVLLTSNTIKLIILARFDWIETMRLVGASDFTIRAPFILEGAFQGILGAILAMGAVHGVEAAVIELTHLHLTSRLIQFPEVIVLLFATGVVLGVLGSYRAVRRFIYLVV